MKKVVNPLGSIIVMRRSRHSPLDLSIFEGHGLGVRGARATRRAMLRRADGRLSLYS